MPSTLRGVLVLAVLLTAARTVPARAEGQEAAAPQTPPNYVTGLLTTTVAYHPEGGSFEGWQHDGTLSVGYGRFLTGSLALELDAGATWVRGDYTAFALVPALVWAFHPKAYAAARFIVPVDPELDLGLSPGIGLTHTFPNGLAPYAEVDAVSYVGRGHPDFGITVTVGVLYSF
jgi:hypothetical protein